jgi:UDP-N-acetylmuramate dehydrogenase
VDAPVAKSGDCRYTRLVASVGKILEKIKLDGFLALEEPMSRHTSFRIGGPAEALVKPRDAEELGRLYTALKTQDIPCFLLGGGANILVADRGIRGAVLDLGSLRGLELLRSPGQGTLLEAWAGTPMSEASEFAAAGGGSGLEFIYSMPGSVGGAVWMNARCYGHSVCEVLRRVQYLRPDGRVEWLEVEADGESPEGPWGYKRSPFQSRPWVILKAVFALAPGDPQAMQGEMRRVREDRERKGHFQLPSAGSVFKNNRDFGAPTGQIIDALGLKGRSVGAARVSELHGNIIVNTGGATAQEVLALIRLIEQEVQRAHGFRLEREVLLVGDW